MPTPDNDRSTTPKLRAATTIRYRFDMFTRPRSQVRRLRRLAHICITPLDHLVPLVDRVLSLVRKCVRPSVIFAIRLALSVADSQCAIEVVLPFRVFSNRINMKTRSVASPRVARAVGEALALRDCPIWGQSA